MIRRHARARAQNTTRTRARSRERVWTAVAEPGTDLRGPSELKVDARHDPLSVFGAIGASER
jgi:hypothetical protein